MGGAMDLVNSEKTRVIVIMEQIAKVRIIRSSKRFYSKLKQEITT